MVCSHLEVHSIRNMVMETLFFILSSTALGYIIKNLEEMKDHMALLSSRVSRIEYKIPKRHGNLPPQE